MVSPGATLPSEERCREPSCVFKLRLRCRPLLVSFALVEDWLRSTTRKRQRLFERKNKRFTKLIFTTFLIIIYTYAKQALRLHILRLCELKFIPEINQSRKSITVFYST